MNAPAVIFDLDDTLYDEITFVQGAMREVAAFVAGRSGTPAPRIHDLLLRELDRNGRGRVFDAALAQLGLPQSLVPTLVYVYRSARPDISLFPAADELLRELRTVGYPLGVLTDGTALVQGAKVDLLGLQDKVDAVVLTDAVGDGRPKPATDGYEIACNLLGVAARDAIYVGNDLRKDYVGPRTLGMRTIHVAHRQLGSVDDVGDDGVPDVIAPTLAEVIELVRPS